MSTQRAHEVVTDDGVTIRATVQGQGPPLVLLQGVMGDGDVDWQALVSHLAERFTCHLPSMRGRGRSDDHPNLWVDRVFTDYTTYVESLGEQVAAYDGARARGPGASQRHHRTGARAARVADAAVLSSERAARRRPRVRRAGGTIPGAGHAGPLTHPDVLAGEPQGFFDAALRSA